MKPDLTILLALFTSVLIILAKDKEENVPPSQALLGQVVKPGDRMVFCLEFPLDGDGCFVPLGPGISLTEYFLNGMAENLMAYA